ncbi:hypothetical protein R1flu_000792 [Riccia fluitans]|uniref:SHSP domain-containing protein n=1 Tax=Riccia fluitans TaxID=41844 RepID=A0ABD1Y4E4_9MARC
MEGSNTGHTSKRSVKMCRDKFPLKKTRLALEEATNQTKYLRIERPSGKFLRKFTLPNNANVDGILVSCTDGILTVTVPKIPPPEPHKPKTIEVKVG